ncbi:MAG: hypothetical protein K2P74_04955, partial [Nitrosomonas sp.]|nr:hypothetical protein [Nitrosomonas sp.]
MILPQRDKEPDLAFAGIAILILFGFLIWHDNPIKSSRPADSTTLQSSDLNIKDHAYESWLWEDPFGKKFQYKSEESSDNSLDQNCTLLRKKIRNSQKKNEDKPVEIFAALLNTTPNTTENKESRTRHRYAKIAALIEAGYSPSEEPNPMHYCRIGTPDDHDKKYNVGWEHFIFMPRPNKEPDSDEKDEKSDVILVWLDNNLFNDKNFKQKNEGNKFLASLINESEKCTNTKNNLYLFDWNYLFKKYAHIRKTHDVHKHIKNSKIIPIVPANYPIKIVQPLRSTLEHSKELIQKLTDELITYRRISALSEIAIIVEQDTQYVRELSKKFESTLS